MFNVHFVLIRLGRLLGADGGPSDGHGALYLGDLLRTLPVRRGVQVADAGHHQQSALPAFRHPPLWHCLHHVHRHKSLNQTHR